MFNFNLQFFAHKKGVGSTKNGRDSESKRLGAKAASASMNLPAVLHPISPAKGLPIPLLRSFQ